jgi:hypothetical protein
MIDRHYSSYCFLAVNTHFIHRRIFLFSTPCDVGSLLCMRNINCKPHWLVICCLSRNSVVIKDRERDVRVQVLQNVKVYFKWGWNKSPFDINSVAFHFLHTFQQLQPPFFNSKLMLVSVNNLFFKTISVINSSQSYGVMHFLDL